MFGEAETDTALHDLVAKARKIPLYKLLGGKLNDESATKYVLPFDKPDKMVKEALEAKEIGFYNFKVKVGLDEGKDVERVKKIREALGYDCQIRIDPNGECSANQAIRI